MTDSADPRTVTDDLIDLFTSHPEIVADSSLELVFALCSTRCRNCRAYPAPDAAPGFKVSFTRVDKVLEVSMSCAGCRAVRRIRAREQGNPFVEPVLHEVTLDGPSRILQPVPLLLAYDHFYADIIEDPATLPIDADTVPTVRIGRARTSVNELLKFVPADGDEVPPSAIDDAGRAYYDAHRARFSRSALVAMKASIDGIWARYLADLPRRDAAYRAKYGPPKVPQGGVGYEDNRAHDAWLANGRHGAGRMVVKHRQLNGQISGRRNLAAIFEGVVFKRCELFASTFDESTFTDCVFDQTGGELFKLAGCQLVGCQIRDSRWNKVTLDGAVLRDCTFDHVEMFRGSFIGATLDRVTLRDAHQHGSVWDHARVSHCDFQGAYLGEAIQWRHLPTTTRGAVFTDCDLRNTCWYRRDLGGATFVRCRLDGSVGVPSAVDDLVLEDCDLDRDTFLQQLAFNARVQDAPYLLGANREKAEAVTSDEQFAAEIADAVALVARGDLAGFFIPGRTTVDRVGAHRFGVVFAALAAEAVTVGATEPLVLRWTFDPPGSPEATQRSLPNARLLVDALRGFARDGRLPAAIRVEFAALGPVPDDLARDLTALGIVVH